MNCARKAYGEQQNDESRVRRRRAGRADSRAITRKSGVTLYRVARGFTVDSLGSRIVGHMIPPRDGEIVMRATQ